MELQQIETASTQPAPMKPFKSHGCGAVYTEEQWNALPLAGYMSMYVKGDLRGEMRACPCGSHIMVDTIACEFCGSRNRVIEDDGTTTCCGNKTTPPAQEFGE